MELPQYIQKQNPSPALLKDTAPRINNTGAEAIKDFGKALSGFLDTYKKEREDEGINNAQREYQEWLVQAKDDLYQTTDMSNLDIKLNDFKDISRTKIGYFLQKNGVTGKRYREMDNKLQLHYMPSNLQYALSVGKNVRTTAFQDKETQYAADVGNIFAQATYAQITGDSGIAMLSQQNMRVDSMYDTAYDEGLITASQKQVLINAAKRRNTAYYLGRAVTLDPAGTKVLLTRGSKIFENAQAEYFITHAETEKYQSLYSNKQVDFNDFQKAINSLDLTTRNRLRIRNAYVGAGDKKDLLTGSYVYNLGALYLDCKKQNIDFKDAVNDENLLRKYSTPWSPYFTKDSQYYSTETKDFAGMWQNDVFIPACLTPGSRYYIKDLEYVTPEMMSTALESIATYEAHNDKKEKEEKQLASVQKLREAIMQNEANNTVVGDSPSFTVYANTEGTVKSATVSSTKSETAGLGDYSNIPRTLPNNEAWPKDKVVKLIENKSTELGVPKALSMAIAEHESGFKPLSLGPTKDMGLFQMIPSTAKEMGVKNPWDPVDNATGGIKYIKVCLNASKGNVTYALRHYNGGPQWRKSKNLNRIIAYSNAVYKLYEKYKRIYGDK